MLSKGKGTYLVVSTLSETKLEYTVSQTLSKMMNMRCVLKHISPIFGRNVCRGVVLCKVRRVRTHLLSAHLPRVSKHHNAS